MNLQTMLESSTVGDDPEKTALGFIDYHWPDKPKSTLLILGHQAFEVADIQEQPVLVKCSTVEVFYWGKWEVTDATYMDTVWLVNELTTREIPFEDTTQ